MRNRSGFTLVEIAVTLVVVGILLTLAVVSFKSSQVSARDSERHADVENIAVALESYHTSRSSGASPGEYPALDMLVIVDPEADNELFQMITERTGQGTLYAPETDPDGPISLKAATNEKTTPQQVTPKPTIDTYIYQPLTDEEPGKLCFKQRVPRCVSFNIYYRLEKPTDECPDGYCILRSKYS